MTDADEVIVDARVPQYHIERLRSDQLLFAAAPPPEAMHAP
jgi:hypothetical protein